MLLLWNYFHLNLINIILFIQIINKRKLESKQIIYLKVMNNFTSVKVINSDYVPSKVYVNGIETPIESNGNIKNQEKGILNVTLEWDKKFAKYTKLFRNVIYIIEADLSNFDTSEVTSIAYMFNNCTNLKKVNLNYINTSLIYDLSYMFENCTKLTTLDLSCFDTKNVLKMEGMFKNCNSLKSLDLSNFYTPKLTKMNEMFYNCNSLTSLDISNFDTSKISNMTSIFEFCYELSYINISHFVTKNVILMTNLFKDCQSLSYVDLSKFDTSNVIDMRDMFSSTNLISLNLSNFNTSKVQYMDYMFYRSSLEFLDVSNFDTSEVISMTYMFSSTNLEYLDISNFDLNQKIMDFFFCFSSLLKSIKFSKEYKLLGSVSHMFWNCYSLTSLDLYNFDFSIVDSMEYLFNSCSSLTSIELYNLDTYSLTNMDSMFSDCVNLKLLDLSNFITSSVKSMSNLFNNCQSLTSIILSDFDTSSVVDMSYMFFCCFNLKSLDLSNFNTSSVTSMIDMFSFCTSLKSLNLSNFNTFQVEDMDGMFSHCEELSVLDLSNFNIENLIDLDSLFYPDSNLEYIKMYNFSFGNYKLDDILNYIEPNIIYCLNTDNIDINDLILKDIYKNCSVNDCSTNWKIYRKKLLPDKGFCIDDCKFSEINRYEYENKCYNQCPKGTHSIKDNIYFCEKNMVECIAYYPFIKIEDSSCLSECTTIDFFYNVCTINNFQNKNESESNMISQIIKDIENDKLFDLLFILFYYEHDFIHISNNIVYQLTTPYIQKKNKKPMVSNIILGECEKILNNKYITEEEEEQLIIFKIDKYFEGILMPLIQYEIYSPEGPQRLNLNECKDKKITINISFPLNINENNLYKYDSNIRYYNDLCYSSISENGTDICLYDRRKEFENYYLCPNYCKFIEYDFNNNKSICNCEIKNGISFEEELTKDILINNFFNKKSLTNFNVLKCCYLLFSKKGMKNNYGIYIIACFIFLYIVSIFLFFFKEHNIICDQINNIINAKLYENELGKNFKNNLKYEIKENSTDIISSTNKYSSYYSKININKLNLKNKMETDSNNINNKIYLDNKININDLSSNQKKVKKILEFTDYEINTIPYNLACERDKRNFCQYYLSLIRTNHIFIFIFNWGTDYNSHIIKLCIFLFSISFTLVTNTLFFNDYVLHQIYCDKGVFNLKYFLPQIIYSAIISSIIITIIRILFLTQKDILTIKHEKKDFHLHARVSLVLKHLKIKFICFFTFSFVFLFLFLFYLSCFCVVYKNTQVYLFKVSLISYLILIIFPFFLFIIPGFLRILSLRNPGKCLYKVSQIIQI